MKTRTIEAKNACNNISISRGCGDQFYIEQGNNLIGVGRKYLGQMIYALVCAYFSRRK
jgi:hypothetical protein